MDDRSDEQRIRAWSQNQILFHEAARALSALRENGIGTIVLKGAALALTCYDDPGERPMFDVDVLVPEADAVRAMSMLESAGWDAEYRPPQAMLLFQHAVGFQNTTGGRIDLHWRVLADGRQDLAEDGWWQASVPFQFAGVETRMLSPADQLLHVCVHGARARHTQPTRWVADASAILRAWTDLDWKAFLAQARTRRLTLPLADALAHIRDTGTAAVPASVVTALRAEPVTAGERRLYRLRTGKASSLRAIALIIEWRRRWSAARGNGGTRPVQLLAYLQSRLGAAHWWQTPFLAVKRIGRAVASDLRS